MKILGSGDFEIVGAWNRQFDRGGPIERRRQMRNVGPQKGLQGIAPARRLAEQFLESAFFRVGVSATIWLDSNLAAQRYRMNRRAALLRDTNHESQRGDSRIAFGTRCFDLETELLQPRRIARIRKTGHPPLSGRGSPLRKSCPRKGAVWDRSRILSKKASTSFQACSPPSKPFQRRRMVPVSA